jgi:AraC-like DNA-binding protein
MMPSHHPLKGDTRRLAFRAPGVLGREPNLPLAVRSAGDYDVDHDWREDTAAKWFLQLFWTVNGAGTFQAGRRTWRVGPGDIFTYEAGEPHRLRADGGRWHYRCITLDSPGARAVVNGFGLTRWCHAGDCPDDLFDRVFQLLQEPTSAACREASIAAYALLEAASRSSRDNPTDTAAAIRQRLDQDFTDPDLGVETVAAALRLHRTTVRRAFLAAYGVGPSTYLARRRLQHALALLRTSARSVAEVAAAAGYRSAEYLARVVRQEFGVTPTAFRHTESSVGRHRDPA